MDKHLANFALEAAFETRECPLCHLMHRNVRRHFEVLFHELVTDGPTRHRILASGGYCPVHTEQARTMGDLLGFSIIWRHVLNQARDGVSSRPGNGASFAQPSLPCPACEIGMQTEEDFARLLSQGLMEMELRDEYRGSWGLCLPHIENVLSRATSEVAEFILSAEAAILSRLEFQLSEIIRKHDYRCADERWGEEVKAPDVAAWKSCGCYEAALATGRGLRGRVTFRR